MEVRMSVRTDLPAGGLTTTRAASVAGLRWLTYGRGWMRRVRGRPSLTTTLGMQSRHDFEQQATSFLGKQIDVAVSALRRNALINTLVRAYFYVVGAALMTFLAASLYTRFDGIVSTMTRQEQETG